VRIFNACAELVPLAKSGGLGDVTTGLTRYLAGAGHDVVTLLPRYGVIAAPAKTNPPVAGPILLKVADETLDYSIYAQETGASLGRVYVVDCPELLGDEIYGSGEREAHRFILLCRAALELCRTLDWPPQIIHCHDWHTALIPAMLRDAEQESYWAGTSTVLTIHNIGYQGVFPARVLRDAGFENLLSLTDPEDLARDEINLLKTGIRHADALTTVSPTYAAEIQSSEFGMGLENLLRQRRHRLQGILNGADYSLWNPQSDPHIEAHYSAESPSNKVRNKTALADEVALDITVDVPLIGMVSRLVLQKGIDLLVAVLPGLLREQDVGCVVLGTGESAYTDQLRALALDWPDRLAFIEAYDEGMAHRILAGSDILVIPSRYEPCGLTQLYALRYGTVPVVRQTGGLADTIRQFDPATGAGNGSVFKQASARGLRWGLSTALDWYRDPNAWNQIVLNGMREDFSWQHRGRDYEALYRTLAGS